MGEKFIAQINQQKEIPEGKPKMNLRVIALSNSRKMILTKTELI
jgi:hypothetical protein